MAQGEVDSGTLGSVSISPQGSWIMPCESPKSSERLSQSLVLVEQGGQRYEHFTPGLSRTSNPGTSSRPSLSSEEHTEGRDGTSCFFRSLCPNLSAQGTLGMAGPLPQREGCQAVTVLTAALS